MTMEEAQERLLVEVRRRLILEARYVLALAEVRKVLALKQVRMAFEERVAVIPAAKAMGRPRTQTVVFSHYSHCLIPQLNVGETDLLLPDYEE